MAKARRGRSPAFMKALRKKYGLGEFRRKKVPAGSRAARPRKPRRKPRDPNLGYPGNSPKEEFYKSIGVPELGFDW